MSNLTSTLAAVVVLAAAAFAGCTAPDLDEAACNEVAAYVRGETSRPRMDLRLDTVAVRCLTLKDQRGW